MFNALLKLKSKIFRVFLLHCKRCLHVMMHSVQLLTKHEKYAVLHPTLLVLNGDS